jgi:hypothetical protein
MKQESLKFLAIELARIYAAYMAELDDYKEEQEPERRLQYQPRFLPTSFSVHRNDLSSTSYNIRSLDQFLPMVFYSGDDEESGVRHVHFNSPPWESLKYIPPSLYTFLSCLIAEPNSGRRPMTTISSSQC